MTSLGLLFGSFNPPHVNHLQRVHDISQISDDVIILPVNTSPGKRLKPQEEFRHKVAMLELLTLGETYQPKISHIFESSAGRYRDITYGISKLATEINARGDVKKIHIVAGADTSTRNRLIAHFLSSRLQNKIPIILLANSKIGNKSSSEIRLRLKRGVPVSGLTPEIYSYIRKNRLYT